MPLENVLRTTLLCTLASVIAVALSACGSTVQEGAISTDRQLGERGSEESLSPVDSLADPEDVASSGDPATDVPLTTTPSQRGGNSGSRTTSSGGSTPELTGEATGRGFSEEEIYIGYSTQKNIGVVLNATGTNADFGDQEAIARAVVDDINRQGGIAGRKIVLVFYDIPTGGSSPAANAQAACTRWTEDRPVFAVLTLPAFGAEETLSACLARQSTPQLNQSVLLRPDSAYSRFAPYLYAPSQPTTERFIPGWVQRVDERRYFAGWDTLRGVPSNSGAKVGVLSRKNFYGADFTRVMRGELERRSRPVAAAAEWSGDYSSVSNEMNAAVLRFREAGVTHVMSSGIGELMFFTQAAASQNYRPRYAISTNHAPASLLTSVAPRGQLVGALGAGYQPAMDVGNNRDPGDSAARTHCRKIMEEAGQDTSDRLAFSLMVLACDGFNLIKAGIERGNFSSDGLQKGIAAMDSMDSAATFHMSFSGGRPDGVTALRDLAYSDACDCFAYLDDVNRPL